MVCERVEPMTYEIFFQAFFFFTPKIWLLILPGSCFYISL